MKLKLVWSYSIDYTILNIEIVVHVFIDTTYYYDGICWNLESIISYPAMTNELRREQCNFFANAQYDSVEKILESVGHVTCIS